MKPFAALLDLIAQIDDPRRAEGKMYRLPHVVLFAILAALAGANSLRTVEAFMAVHLKRLRRHFDLTWKRAPAHTTIRSILLHLDPDDVAALANRSTGTGLHVAIDGQTLRGSFDSFEDRKAAHGLSAFASSLASTLAHLDCGEKSNEIAAVQQLVKELGLPPGALITLDAMHGQKKPSRPPPRPARHPRNDDVPATERRCVRTGPSRGDNHPCRYRSRRDLRRKTGTEDQGRGPKP